MCAIFSSYQNELRVKNNGNLDELTPPRIVDNQKSAARKSVEKSELLNTIVPPNAET